MALGGKREGAGRKKGYPAIQAELQRKMICEKLEKEFPPIIDKAIELAKLGDYKAREWLADRAYGKAAQIVQTEDDEGNRAAITSIVVTPISDK